MCHTQQNICSPARHPTFTFTDKERKKSDQKNAKTFMKAANS